MTFTKHLNRNLSNRVNFEKSENKKKQLLQELRENKRAYCPDLNHPKESPNLDTSFGSQLSLEEEEIPPSKQTKVSVMPKPMTNENDTCSSIPTKSQTANLRPAERLEEAGLEIQSIEPAGNGVSIRSSSPIEETEIKVEIPNA